MSWAVVVPTVRAEKFREFIAAWNPLFKKHQAVPILCQDSAADLTDTGWIKYNHASIPGWFPRGSDMIRSWGIYRAWLGGFDYTLSLDDDVTPVGDPFEAYERVFRSGAPCSQYFDVGALTSFGKPLRGFPYKDRVPAEVAIQYGGWDGVLDYDAATQLAAPQRDHTFSRSVVAVPRGAPVTGCAMNMAWRTDYAPVMWQLPLFEGRFNRFGDIWAGLFAKRVLDHLGKAVVVNGEATVGHVRASDPVANLERETPGVRLNEEIWDHLYTPTGARVLSCYEAVTDSAHWLFRRRDPMYAAHFKECRDKWLDLYK